MATSLRVQHPQTKCQNADEDVHFPTFAKCNPQTFQSKNKQTSTILIGQRQTHPKMAEAQASGSGQMMGIDHSDSRDCAQRRPQSQESRDRFIKSLASPKTLFSHVTIEPFTCLAIIALYIEFPAIQDLIYTKTCLEVVTSHQNLTAFSHSGIINRSISDNINAIKTLTLQVSRNQSTTNKLPLLSQIQHATSPEYEIPSIADRRTSDELALCDRFNNKGIPPEVRREILEVDSLFWIKYQILVGVLCALSGPYWGGLSDKIGRLVPLSAPVVASILSNSIALAFGVLINLKLHNLVQLNWLLIGAVIVGVSGGQGIIIMNAFGFLSDTTTTEDRAKRVTILESVNYLSHSVGFFLSRYIMRLSVGSLERPWLNRHVVAFSLCILLNLICLIFAIARLRNHVFHKFLNNFEREQQEAAILADKLNARSKTSSIDDLAKRKEEAEASVANGERLRELTSSTPDDLDGPICRMDKKWSVWDAFVTISYYKQTLVTLAKRRQSRSIILLLLLCGFISALSLATQMSLLFLYLKLDPINWTTSQYSFWNSITFVTRGAALVALSLCMRFMTGWNIPEPLVAAVGFLSKASGLFMIGLANSSTLINWSLVALTLSEFSMPPIRSLLSKLVVKEELGKIYSCLGTLQGICFITGNVVFYFALNSLRAQDFFRLSFIVVASIELIAVAIMISIFFSLRRRVLIV